MGNYLGKCLRTGLGNRLATLVGNCLAEYIGAACQSELQVDDAGVDDPPTQALNQFNADDSTSSRDFCGCGTVDVATQMQVRRLPGYVWLESSADHKVRAWVVWWYYFQQWQLFLTMCREERRLGGIDVE